MDIMRQIVGIVILGVWGYTIYEQCILDTLFHFPILFTISVILFLFVFIILSYSIYHRLRYHRSCCWQCLTFEHNTCRLSHISQMKSQKYHKPINRKLN